MKTLFLPERHLLKLFVPLFIFLGFCCCLPFKILSVWCGVFYVGVLVVAFFSNKKYLLFYPLATLCGVLIWKVVQVPRTAQMQITQPYQNIILTCTAEDILSKKDFLNIICTNVAMQSNQDGLQLIKKIKLVVESKNSQNIAIGDIITAKVNLEPLTQKIHPFAYNYNLQMLYQGYGSGGSIVEIINIVKSQSNQYFLQNLRNKISLHIKENILQQDEFSIVNALITGQRGEISHKTNNEVSISGLSHILSISGLHIAIVAGFFMLIFRFCITPLFGQKVLFFNPRKPAAAFAIFGSLCYLVLSGFLVPALRSFVMFSLILIAIITDKKALTFHSLMLAAVVCLVISPFSVFFASFQLSFAAVICLVVTFNFLTQKLKNRSWWVRYVLGIVISSLFIAFSSFYTVIYHFGRFSFSSMFANIFAIPLVSFVIMPACVMYSIFYLCGLNFMAILSLKICQYGVWAMLLIAKIFSSQSWFYFSLMQPTQWMFCGAFFALLWFALFTSGIRYIGLGVYGLISICYIYRLLTTTALLTINNDMAIYNFRGKYYQSGAADSYFVKNIWMQEMGLKNNPYKTNENKQNILLSNGVMIIGNLDSLKEQNQNLCNSSYKYFIMGERDINKILSIFLQCKKNNYKHKIFNGASQTPANALLNKQEIQKWLELENNIFCYLDFNFYGTHTIYKNNKDDIFIYKVYE